MDSASFPSPDGIFAGILCSADADAIPGNGRIAIFDAERPWSAGYPVGCYLAERFSDVRRIHDDTVHGVH